MSLEPIQIERVREIIGFTSFDATAALLSRLNSVQESETVADVVDWNAVRKKFSRLEGGKFGISKNKDDIRLAICNRVRTRLGLGRVTSVDEPETTGSQYLALHPAVSESDYDCHEINGVFE